MWDSAICFTCFTFANPKLTCAVLCHISTISFQFEVIAMQLHKDQNGIDLYCIFLICNWQLFDHLLMFPSYGVLSPLLFAVSADN